MYYRPAYTTYVTITCTLLIVWEIMCIEILLELLIRTPDSLTRPQDYKTLFRVQLR